jgi:hypothetical protein
MHVVEQVVLLQAVLTVTELCVWTCIRTNLHVCMSFSNIGQVNLNAALVLCISSHWLTRAYCKLLLAALARHTEHCTAQHALAWPARAVYLTAAARQPLFHGCY